MTDTFLGPRFKSFPAESWGSTLDSFLRRPRALSAFQTPLLTLERPALSSNTRVMFDWLVGEGLSIAPHGKTTMAPTLWRELLEAGAWGLSFATAWQAQCARSFGVDRILLANALVDPVALRWLVGELREAPEFEFVSWVDSVRTVELMTDLLLEAAGDAGMPRPIPVIIELGGRNGRTGARSVEQAVRVADAVRRSPVLAVGGVGGYEGALAHDRSPDSIATVDGYLDEVLRLHRALRDGGYYGDRAPIVTAGGSAYFDRVAERLAPARDDAIVLLRSGAFQVHDDGFYGRVSPMGGAVAEEPFRAAMHAWVRVVSRPEPGLALVDGGKRDLPYDEGMPVPQRIVGKSARESAEILDGAHITALNDQHGYLRLAEPGTASTAAAAAGSGTGSETGSETGIDRLPVGSVVRLGLSHPCTAFDKWRLIPVIDDADAADPRVVDAVETWF